MSAALFETQSMITVGPKIESKVVWQSKNSREPRYVVTPTEATDLRTRSIFGVEEEGVEEEEGKRLTLGVVALEAGLKDGWALRIKWRSCVAFVKASTSSVSLSNANDEVELDARSWVILKSGVLGGVWILVIGVRVDAVDITLCGSRREKSSDNVVVGKCWSIALVKTVERKEKNVMSASRWSETAISFPEESRNSIP